MDTYINHVEKLIKDQCLFVPDESLDEVYVPLGDVSQFILNETANINLAPFYDDSFSSNAILDILIAFVRYVKDVKIESKEAAESAVKHLEDAFNSIGSYVANTIIDILPSVIQDVKDARRDRRDFQNV